MKKSLLAILLICAMVLALFGGAVAVHAAPAEVFADDFSDASLSGKYTVVADTAAVVDGKLVIDSTATVYGGAMITKQKVTSFVLEFDLNNACEGGNTFSVITGIQNKDVFDLNDWNKSAVLFGSVDSMCVNNSAGQWQRYSWYNVPVKTDVRVRITVDTGVFKIEHKAAGADWVVIEDHAGGALSLQPTEGYIALAINGAGKATIDNISLTAEPAAEEPTPSEPKPTEPAPTEPKPTEPAPTEPAPTEPKPTVPAGEFYWEDNFDGRTELGEMYSNNLGATGSVSIVDGKLKFDKIADATGVFLNTQAMGNKFTVSFDLNMQEGSSPAAFLFGIDNPGAVMYWDGSINRFSMAMDAYRMGCAGTEMAYVPGSGTDTDAAVAYQAAWFQAHCTPVNKAEDEYLNVRLVFDVVDGENTLTVYYKLNTEADSELEKARVTWKGVDAAGYIGIVSQGASADFTIDNLVITDREELPDDGNDTTPETGATTPETDATTPDATVPETGDRFVGTIAAVLMALSLTAVVALPHCRRRSNG